MRFLEWHFLPPKRVWTWNGAVNLTEVCQNQVCKTLKNSMILSQVLKNFLTDIISFADLVCFLDVSAEVAAQRGEYGKEKYEVQTFQEEVRKNYMKLMEEDNWEVIQTDHKTLDQVYSEIEKIVNTVLKNDKGPIEPLWPMK